MSEVDDAISELGDKGRAWRTGMGLIDSSPMLSAWGRELIEKSKTHSPPFGAVYVFRVLKLLAEKHGLPESQRLTMGMVHSWWARNK